MKPTRREFLITAAAAVAATGWGGSVAAVPSAAGGGASPLLMDGDPYLAAVDEVGLGGRSFDAARQHALRFRSAPADRDRLLLGLES